MVGFDILRMGLIRRYIWMEYYDQLTPLALYYGASRLVMLHLASPLQDLLLQDRV